MSSKKSKTLKILSKKSLYIQSYPDFTKFLASAKYGIFGSAFIRKNIFRTNFFLSKVAYNKRSIAQEASALFFIAFIIIATLYGYTMHHLNIFQFLMAKRKCDQL